MLAYNLMDSEELNYDFLLKVREAPTASAYIVKDHYFDVLINLYEEAVQLLGQTGEHWNYANDQCWKSLQRKDNLSFFFIIRYKHTFFTLFYKPEKIDLENSLSY